MDIAPVTLTYPDGSTITLSRQGDVVTAVANPSSTFNNPTPALPIPDGFEPRGNTSQFSFRSDSNGTAAGQYAMVIDELGAVGDIGIYLSVFTSGPYPSFEAQWLAEPDNSSQIDNSILNSTKKILGLDAGYTRFDLDVITHINSTFSQLAQLGCGPAQGFYIENDTKQWSDFLGDSPLLNFVKTYMYLKVRMWFDPPTTSFDLSAKKEQITELEWRINVAADRPVVVDPPVDETV